MSEWIKFSFEMLTDTVACDLVSYLDGVQLQSQSIRMEADDDHPNAKKCDTWVEISDDIANGSGDHNIRINVVERLDADTGNPIHEFPMVELVGIELSGSARTPAEGNINTSVKVYNILNDDYQALIDAGQASHDSNFSGDIGNGMHNYSVSSWDDYKVIGNGAWVLEFTCPYLTWYNAVHAD